MSIKSLVTSSQRGDTIVEVLIVLVVLASVIGSAYVIATRTLQDNQNTQEHAYALKLAEGQIELLKAKSLYQPSVLSTPSPFCINDSDPYNVVLGLCKKNPNNATNPTDCTGGFCYSYGLSKVTSPDNSYSAIVQWDSIRGNPQQVELVYRIYP